MLRGRQPVINENGQLKRILVDGGYIEGGQYYFYLNTSKQKKSGKCPIMGRISIDSKNTAFSIGLDIFPKDWGAQTGLAIGKSDETKTINRQIDICKNELSKHYRNMVINQGCVTAEALKNALKGIGTNRNTLMQEFAELVEEKRKSIGIKIKESTYPVYPTAYRHLKEFLQQKYKVEDITFPQINIAFIEAYAFYLKIDLQMTPRTVKGNMIPFRMTVTRAKNKGLIRQDPFFDYTPKRLCPNVLG